MKGAKEFLTIWAFLIAGYLILEHYTGFSSDVNAVSQAGGTLTKDLQGR
jgi:hypothetical protein